MNLEKRIEKIEEECNIKHSCMLLITVWDGTEGPTKEQSDQYREHQRESGECENCGGICVLDWGAKPPKIWRQQSVKDLRSVAHDVNFVIGKGYADSKEH